MKLARIIVVLASSIMAVWGHDGLNLTGQNLWTTSGILTDSPPQGFSSPFTVSPPDILLNLQPKVMWGWEAARSPGFCGEASFQVAAQYFGSYISQGLINTAAGDEELLIGVNDEKAAKNLGLNYETLTPGTPAEILPFIQAHTRSGHVVIAGVYIWYRRARGDSDYDHIVPVLGSVSSQGSGSAIDTVAYTDLATPRIRLMQGSKIITSRGDAASNLRAEYKDLQYSISSKGYLGAVSGIVDEKNQNIRTRIATNSSSEPDWSAVDKLKELPEAVKISAYVYGLECGKQYKIFRYDGSPPAADFHLGKFSKVFAFYATGPEMSFPDHDVVQSNGAYHYRTMQLND